MSIDASIQDLPSLSPRPADVATGAATARAAIVSDDAAVTVTQGQVLAAVEQIRAHLSSVHGSSRFTVDYLSGLDVVTVRAPETGDVIFQLPNTVAVNLARLIKDGASLSSLGLLDAKA